MPLPSSLRLLEIVSKYPRKFCLVTLDILNLVSAFLKSVQSSQVHAQICPAMKNETMIPTHIMAIVITRSSWVVPIKVKISKLIILLISLDFEYITANRAEAIIGHAIADPNNAARNWYDVRASIPSSVESPSNLPSVTWKPSPIIDIGNTAKKIQSLTKARGAFRRFALRKSRPLEFKSRPSKLCLESSFPALTAALCLILVNFLVTNFVSSVKSSSFWLTLID